MKRLIPLLGLLITTAAVAAPLFKSASESKWSVTNDGKDAGTVTLLTRADGARAEWRASAKSPVIVYLGDGSKVWVRETGGDVDTATHKGGDHKLFLPALITEQSNAKYRRDEKGPVEINVNGYTLRRTSLSASNADASQFAVRPKAGAAARLARLSGDLLGPSQSTVSATAGGRGVGTKGLKLNDGGDYEAVEALENRDATWSANLDGALEEFHREGKVGKAREDQR